jgi:hypothetical protein
LGYYPEAAPNRKASIARTLKGIVKKNETR